MLMLLLTFVAGGSGGCASIRVTDPARSATEEFLENVATTMAVDKLSTAVLRDRKVYVETTYLTASTQPSNEHQYLLGELRSKLLLNGVRLVDHREQAEIVMEVRSQGISIDRVEFLLGLPASSVGGIFTGGVAASTPELSIIKTTKQHGFASVAYIAYWADSGEVVASSGPFVGYTIRDDWWFFGWGPRTIGNIAPAQPPPPEATGAAPPTTAPAKKNELKTGPVQGFKGKGPSAGR
jgi:hypothetical protein